MLTFQGRLPAFIRFIFSYAGFTALFLCCVLGILLTDQWLFLVAPFGIAILLWAIQDFRRLYFLMWAAIPFSIEMDLPGGFSTDFPAEPFMWLCCLMLIFYLFLYHRSIDFRFIFHPVVIAVMIHFAWIVITTIVSTQFVISIKYTLAKSWYIITFLIIPLVLFRKLEDIRSWLFAFLLPLAITVGIVLLRHSQTGFSFSTINAAVMPLYRNHVDYACLLGIVLPFTWIMRRWIMERMPAALFYLITVMMVAGIYFSYTRAAWLCIPLAFGLYFVIRMKWMRILIVAAITGVVLFIGWLGYNNTYLEFAPSYEKTISHERFDDLVSATYKLEDISTVERIYRWVAGFYMIQEKPLFGFGPSSFYSNYHNYADRHFITYVSDNPEHSGMHNYYLMTVVEQGIPGLLIFAGMLLLILLYGENVYHKLPPGNMRLLLMATMLSLCCNLFVLTLNDMVETDKLGSFFFLSIALIIFVGLHHESKPGDAVMKLPS